LVIINPHSRHCHTEATAQQSYGLCEKAVSKISRLDEQIKNKFRRMAGAALLALCPALYLAPRAGWKREGAAKASRIFDLRCVIDCSSDLSAGAREFRHYLERRESSM
jgi:hypothetical protein